MGREKQIEEMNKEQMKDELILIVKSEIGASSLGDYGVPLYDNDVAHVAEDIADDIYEAGYRKTFTSEIASEEQKAFKEGYDKGFLDGREEFDIILQRNKQLLQALEISKSDIERLKTQLQQANAGIVNCIGCYLVELNAVKDFAEKLKEKALSHCKIINCYELTFIEETINELLKEYEQ